MEPILQMADPDLESYTNPNGSSIQVLTEGAGIDETRRQSLLPGAWPRPALVSGLPASS